MLFCSSAIQAADEFTLPQGVKRVEIFLLMGQSNMKGRGQVPEVQTEHPRILNMNMVDDRWCPAKHPLHKIDDPDLLNRPDNTGVGPGLDFARVLAERDEDVLIALIPVAWGGSSIKRWTKGADLYERTIRKANKALTDFPEGKARIAGALWLQGESDTFEDRYGPYAGKLDAMIQSLRRDMELPELPFIACTIGSFIRNIEKFPHVKEINEDLMELPKRLPRTACVDARDIKGHIGDYLHFNTESQIIIGQRFAKSYLKLAELKPTLAEVPYGKHERHVLDFWKAESDTPTPLVFAIHGGAWVTGSKKNFSKFIDIEAFLNAGISVVAINYRLMKHSKDVVPPVKAPLHDAARALQFVRSKADEWNIDKERIGAIGGSAGACSSLWLLYHDDMADANSDDPVARQSTRLWCASVYNAQTSLDPKQMKEWIPNITYGGHAFEFGRPATGEAFTRFLADREKILPWIKEYSPYANVSADDPPAALFYKWTPGIDEVDNVATHSAHFGVKLQEHCVKLGVVCDVVYPGARDVKHETLTDYLIATLKAPAEEK
jgi:acetyl esterase/lipase